MPKELLSQGELAARQYDDPTIKPKTILPEGEAHGEHPGEGEIIGIVDEETWEKDPDIIGRALAAGKDVVLKKRKLLIGFGLASVLGGAYAVYLALKKPDNIVIDEVEPEDVNR